MECRENCDIADKYRLDLSYPKAVVTNPNIAYAKLLLGDYAGHVSELGATAQYIFHMTVLKKEYPEVSQALLGVSIVEMEHLEMLGELIDALGVPPEYKAPKNGKKIYWDASPRNVNYSTDIKKALLADINIEMKAIEQYEKSISQIGDDKIVCLLRRIILDEQLHIDIFSDLYKKFA